MKKIKIALIISFFISGNKTLPERHVITYIAPQSPSVNTARELTGWEHQVNIFTCDGWYAACALTAELTRTFRPERIAQAFFGDSTLSEKRTFKTFDVSGSQTCRCTYDWLADYFGLPTDFKSRIQVEPRIYNAIINLSTYVGLNCIKEGLYIRAHLPLEYTHWNLNLKECVLDEGTNAHCPGYFNETGIPRENLLRCFTQFMSGCNTICAEGLTLEPLYNSKISPCSLTKTRLAELVIALGWNALYEPDKHFGLNVRSAIPFGNRPEGFFLFEPIVGNGHHYEFGFGISAHTTIPCNFDQDEKVEVYGNFNITHMFGTRQRRSFDLKSKPNSRYMLAENMGTPIEDNLVGGGSFNPPCFQYKKCMTPIANLTTFDVDVSIGVQMDLALMLAYTKCDHSWMIGYGYWGRTCESVHPRCTPPLCNSGCLWAIKGDAHVFGFEDTTDNPPVALSASQSKATIHTGRNFSKPFSCCVCPDDIEQGKTNPNIDCPNPAFADSQNSGSFNILTSQPGGTNQINTSIQPEIIRPEDINCNSGRSLSSAHKVFGYFGKECCASEHIVSYGGFGTEVEFGRAAGKTPPNLKEPCLNSALSFWAIWLKGGISF